MLIAAAWAFSAAAMLRAESEHVMRLTSGSATLSTRAPGQMPRMPTPFAGAAAAVLVAVPWKSTTGPAPVLKIPDPTISGWVRSIWVSTIAISGLVGVTGGGTCPSTTWALQPAEGESGSGAGGTGPGGAGSGSAGGAGAWARRLIRFGSAYSSRRD